MRSFSTITLTVSVVLLLTCVAKAQRPKVYYPESPRGLQRQLGDIIAAAEEGRDNLLTTYVSQLVIPAQRTWLAYTFGNERSRPVVEEYRELSRDVQGLKIHLSDVVAKGRTEVHVTELRGPNDPAARGLQKRAFLAMRHHQHLYTVSLTRPGEQTGTKLWSFVYVDGAFRFTGKMRALTKVPVETQ